MLTKLSLKNIKSYKNESELHIAPITLIYGRNSAGKSTLWKLLRVLNLSEYRKNSYFPLSIINPINQDFFSNIKSFSFNNRNPFSIGFEFLDRGSYSRIDEDFPNIGEPQKVKFNYGMPGGLFEALTFKIHPGEKVGLVGRSGDAQDLAI